MKTVMLSAAVALVALSSSVVLAKEPGRCIDSTRIDRTEIVNSSTILFHMKGGDGTLRNTLSPACPSLKFKDGFVYQSKGNTVCAGEMIRLRNHGGSCTLGDFSTVAQ